MSKELQQYIESEKEEAAAIERKNTQMLIKRLSAEGRMNELVKACDDNPFFDKLLMECSLSNRIIDLS